MSKVYITSQLNNKNKNKNKNSTTTLANLHETNAYMEFMTLDEERKTFNYEDYTFTLERIWTNPKYRNIRLIANANEFLISDNNQELVDSLSFMTKIMHKRLNA